MSAQAVTWAYKQNISPPTAKFVLVTLADAANGEGYCWPGQQRLMQLTGMSERALRDQIKTLESLGYIHRERRTRSNGSRTSDGYWLLGFADLPADIAASLPATSAGRQPADSAARTNSQPAESAAPNRQILPPHTNPKGEPKEIDTSSPTQYLSPLPANRRQRPRDIHWDTMVEIHGFSPTPETPEHSRWNKAASIWRRLNVTPDEMRLAAMLYRQEHRDVAFTVMALASNAERLLRGHKPEPPPRIEDIRNPMVRAAMTVDLSDIRAELEAKRDRRRGLSEPTSGSRQFPADARRIGPGE